MYSVFDILLKHLDDNVRKKAKIVLSGLFSTYFREFYNANEPIPDSTFEKNLKVFFKKLETVPEKKLLPVPLVVGVPVIKCLDYVSSPELLNIYINLLLKASIRETSNHVLPKFVQMAESLSEDEARLINYFSRKEYIPFISFRKYIEKKIGYNEFANRLTGIELEIELRTPSFIGMYFENFSAIGLLYTSWGFKDADNKIYNKLITKYKEKDSDITRILNHENTEDRVIRGYFNFTELGKSFLKVTGDLD